MRHRKIAVSLAVIGAVAAPFITGTAKMRPVSETCVPITEDEEKRLTDYLKEENYCVGPKFENNFAARYVCREDLKTLYRSAKYEAYPSLLKYLAANALAIIAGFVSIFGLAMLLPALFRRYWKWLNT